jgi:hypothetical protein
MTLYIENPKHSAKILEPISEFSIISAILLLGIHPKECKSGYSKGTCTPIFIVALFTIAELWKQPRCPTTDKWIKKMWYLYTMEFYSCTNKNYFCHL